MAASRMLGSRQPVVFWEREGEDSVEKGPKYQVIGGSWVKTAISYAFLSWGNHERVGMIWDGVCHREGKGEKCP